MEEVEEVRFVASNLGLRVEDSKTWKKWKKYDLLQAIVGNLGFSVKDWKKWKTCRKWKKYDLLPAIWA